MNLHSNMLRTKLICTIGPSSAKVTTLSAMMRAGMRVCRLNLSHGDHAGHTELMKLIRSASKKTKREVALLGDLQGPKIRLGDIEQRVLKKGEKITFVSSKAKEGELPVTFKQLAKVVKRSQRILINDGRVETKVTKVDGSRVHVKVVVGGEISAHKGMNLPDTKHPIPSLTAKDKKDVEFLVASKVDWIALSFVSTVKDIRLLRKLIDKHTKRGQIPPRILIKIERAEAIERFDDLLEEADGVMVARGDLGIEIPQEEVPLHQKDIIEKCRLAGKPVIVATHLLDSMVISPKPTRAEVSDVANAVFDHTDGLLLSAETAVGRHPIEAVKTLARIAESAERSYFDDIVLYEDAPGGEIDDLSHLVKQLVKTGDIDKVITSDERLLKTHPEVDCIQICPDISCLRQNLLRWGMEPLVMKTGLKKTFAKRALNLAKKAKKVKKGEKVAIVHSDEILIV